MTPGALPLATHRPPALPRPVELIAFALIVANAVYLIAAYSQGLWLTGPLGGVETDFVNVWAAGKLVLEGHPASAYDWPTHKAIEEIAVGHRFDGYFGWHYPPMFLFAAAALAAIPYAPSLVVWMAVTFPIYVAAIGAICRERSGYCLAAAFPAVLANAIVGQNGFLTAGLLGGTLLFVDRRPVVAGICLGLLTYKPHLGLLFPVVLAAAGYWRVFFTAAAVSAVIATMSLIAFGGETWLAFFASISQTSQAFLSDGWANFGKLQSVFGLARMTGTPESIAWTLQIVVALAVAVSVSLIWRRNHAAELKAAALGTGAMLATPYLYTYDLVVLAVPLAFLFRLGRERGFARGELPGIGLACLLVLIFPFVTAPVGLAATLVVAALVARRILLRTA